MKSGRSILTASWLFNPCVRVHAPFAEMHYGTFSTSSNPGPRLGARVGNRVLDLQAAQVDGRRAAPDTLLELIQQGADAWTFAAEVARAEVRLKPNASKEILNRRDRRGHHPKNSLRSLRAPR